MGSLRNNHKMLHVMVIHVEDVETDALVRELAAKRGIGITTAIKDALDFDARSSRHGTQREQLNELFERWDRLPKSHMKTDKAFFDELWGEGR